MNGGSYATSYNHFDSFDSFVYNNHGGQQQQQPITFGISQSAQHGGKSSAGAPASSSSNLPCIEGYNPAGTSQSLSTSEVGHLYHVGDSSSAIGVGTSLHQPHRLAQHHHHHHHNPIHHHLQQPAALQNHHASAGSNSSQHHNLLMSAVAAVGYQSQAMAILNAHQQQQQQTQEQQLFGNSCLNSLSGAADSPSAQQGQQQQRALQGDSAAAIAASFSQVFESLQNNATNTVALGHSQQQHAQSRHNRHNSFDELLMMSPSLLSTAATLDLLPTLVNQNASVASLVHHAGQAALAQSAAAEAMKANNRLNQQPVDAWLDELTISIPSLSLEPMTGTEIILRSRQKMDDVMTRYIPCVDFLVQCQQDLRKGLVIANQRPRHTYGRNKRNQMFMSSLEFYNTYIDHLPQNFYIKNQFTMESSALQSALKGLHDLKADAKTTQPQGCEAMKNSFLGGMKDGESWGLRKWLSKNGNALSICTDLECILNACQKLDRNADSTKKLAEILRPLAQQTLNRLKSDIPASYQERSSAHPYLPFFHRLESALRGMSNFNPEDDGIICLDDDDEDDDDDVVEEVMAEPKPKRRARTSESNGTRSPSPDSVPDRQSDKKRKADDSTGETSKRFASALHIADNAADDGSSSSGESDEGSVVEIVDVVKAPENMGIEDEIDNDWWCAACETFNEVDSSCSQCGKSPADSVSDDKGTKTATAGKTKKERNKTEQRTGGANKSKRGAKISSKGSSQVVATKAQSSGTSGNSLLCLPDDRIPKVGEAAVVMALALEQVADCFANDKGDGIRPKLAPRGTFWDGIRYAEALRLLVTLLRSPDALHFIERVDDDRLIAAGLPPFSHVIKNPLCFRDIASALVQLDEDIQGLPVTEDGRLSVSGLRAWNMWKGIDLLQAIDLVFLNALAYGKAADQGRSSHRTMTNKLRRNFWNGINDILARHSGVDTERRKQYTPTRRSETSGFVVYKIRER